VVAQSRGLRALRVITLLGACTTLPGRAAEPVSAPVISPASMQSLFAPAGTWTTPSTAQKIESEQALNYFGSLALDDLTVSGFMASRRPQPEAADYRTYLGVRYARTLTDGIALNGHTFYGAGTYSGDNSYVDPETGALPAEVSASGAPVGEWVGADLQVHSKVLERHAVQAGFEFRQQLAMDLLGQEKLFGKSVMANDAAPLRTMDFVANSEVALASDLSLNAGIRYDDTQRAPSKAVDPRVEVRYKPQESTTLSAMFDRKNDEAIATDRATPLINMAQDSNEVRNYALAYEQALTQHDSVRLSAFRYDAEGMVDSSTGQIDAAGFEVGMERKQPDGIRTNVSYAWQQTQSLIDGATQGSVARRLTKVGLGFPIFARKLSTGLELQYHDIFSPTMGQTYDYIVGNLTLASSELARDTNLSIGVRDTFRARDTGTASAFLPLLPVNGRSLRVDVKRKF
jgi:TonB dependent receptor